MIYFVAMGFILLDVATGIVKALKNGALKSSKMREGLFNKSGLGLCMCLGYGVDLARAVLSFDATEAAGPAVCLYIIGMEMLSITENVCAISPELTPEAIKRILGGGIRR